MNGELVLVTGGSGVVGSALVQQLLDEGEEIACIVHTTPMPEGTPVQCLHGDLTQTDLGLGRPRRRDLARRVRAIVHCAAVVEFNADHRVIHGLNVRGTERILEFAAEAEAPLFYTSSAFIANAEMLEDEESGVGGGLREYLRSKKVAEDIVRRSGLRYSINRPPLLMSDSRTGRITREQALHKVLAGIALGTLPFLPWGLDTRADFIPQDLMARALSGLLHADAADGGEYWITAGEAAISVRTVVETCVGTMAELGVEVTPPPAFELEMVKRLIVPAFRDTFSERDQQRLDALVALSTVFGTDKPFPSSFGEMPGSPPAPTPADLRDVLALTVERTWAPAAGGGRLAEVG